MSKLFGISFVAAIVAYGLSFLSTKIPVIDAITSVTAAVVAIVLFRRSLALGVSMVLAELVFGSFGRVFVLDLGPVSITVRQILFVIALSAGIIAAGYRMSRSRQIVDSLKNWWPLMIVLGAVVYGVFRGIILGTPLSSIIGDVNGYAPLILAPLFVLALKEDRSLQRILPVVFGVSAALSVLTFFILWMFTHNLPEPVLRELYVWIRDERIGEITRAPGGFYRVFFQSHIWILISYFLALGFFQTKKARVLPALLVVLASGTLLISFSRAFWLGLVVGLVVTLIIVVRAKQMRPQTWQTVGAIILLTGVGILLAFGVSRSIGGVVSSRLLSVSGEAAADSRWNLLPVMWNAIREHPILGYGFGKELTYTTRDPRIIAEIGGDQYTTYAFEWGYLDFWLKMGIVGLVGYLILIVSIFRLLLTRLGREAGDGQSWITTGMISSFAAIAVVHIFSPYLNHPLGIGFLLLAFAYAI